MKGGGERKDFDSLEPQIAGRCTFWQWRVESLEILRTAERTRTLFVGAANWAPVWAHPPRDQTALHLGSWKAVEHERHLWQTETK